MGKPFMPWQQHVVDVATEIDPATGSLWYREVIVTVPRQSGKTTLLLPKWIWRAEASHLLGGRQRMLYAAQTKNDAIDKFDEDFIEDLAAARVMHGRYRVTNVGGRKRIRFRSGSLLLPVATTVKSGHGKTLDDGTLDEAFAQVDNRVEAAWRPAMITRPNAQLWIVSTAGTAESTYLLGKVQRGRAMVERADPMGRLAHFEWSIPDGADLEDPAVWWAHHPALGYTITEDAIRHELDTIEGGLPEFERAYGNRWPDGLAMQVLPVESWQHCADAESQRASSPVICLDLSPDRSTAAVSMAATRADGLPMVQVVRHGPGTDWAFDHVVDLWRTKSPPFVVIDSVGPANSLVDRLLNAGVQVQIMNTPDLADACGSLYDAVITEQLRHCDQAELNEAVRGAAKRDLGDRWAWKRRTSTADITPLVSATGALWGLGKAGAPSVW